MDSRPRMQTWLVHAIEPRVAILNNGTRKGGQPEAMKVLYSAPGLEDLWQLHLSLLSGQEYTVPGIFIANAIDEEPPTMPVAPMPQPSRGSGAPPPPVHDGPAYWIKVSAEEGWFLHRHEQPERLQQGVRGGTIDPSNGTYESLVRCRPCLSWRSDGSAWGVATNQPRVPILRKLSCWPSGMSWAFLESWCGFRWQRVPVSVQNGLCEGLDPL